MRLAIPVLVAVSLAASGVTDVAHAVPLACLKERAGENLPFTAELLEARSIDDSTGGGTGSVHWLQALVEAKAAALNSPLLDDVPGLMESLEVCLPTLAKEYPGPSQERRRLVALAMLAGARLRGARAAGNEAEVRSAAAIVGRVRRQIAKDNIPLERADQLRLFVLDTEVSLAVAEHGPSDNAAVLALVRDTLSQLMRAGAAPGSPFRDYLDTVNAPLREALRLLSEAKVQRVRALALARGVLSQGPDEFRRPEVLVGGERALYRNAVKAWQEAASPPSKDGLVPDSPNESSYTRLMARRESLAEMAAQLDGAASRALAEVCVYRSTTNSADTDACLRIDYATNEGDAIGAFEARYPDPPLDLVAPLAEMDAALAKLAVKLDMELGRMTWHDDDSRARAASIFKALAGGGIEGRPPSAITPDWSRDGSDTFLDLRPATTERDARDVALRSCEDGEQWSNAVERIEGPRHAVLNRLRDLLSAPVGQADTRRIPANPDFGDQCGLAVDYLRQAGTGR